MAKEVEVKGAAEASRRLGRFSKDLQRELQRELRKAAEPIAEATRRRAEKFGSRSTVTGIRSASARGAAFVRQRRGKTTGQHPNYGGLQMRDAFLPSLWEGEAGVVKEIDDLVGDLVRKVDGGPI